MKEKEKNFRSPLKTDLLDETTPGPGPGPVDDGVGENDAKRELSPEPAVESAPPGGGSVSPEGDEPVERKEPAESHVAAPPVEKSMAQGETQGAVADPFGYDATLTWPLVGFEAPYLLPMPDGVDETATATITIRIPINLEQTLKRHHRKLGVTNLSDWMREAVKRQLSAEQKAMQGKA